MEANDNLKDRTLTLKKTFEVPVKVVWKAWTQPEHIAQWWGPSGMKTNVIEHDFRVGGKWKYVMAMPDGSEFIGHGVYSEIINMKRIITTANFIPMTEGVELNIQFESKGSKTDFTFSVIHPTVEYCRQQEKMGFYNGWGSTFKRLETFVETLK